jgi:predicted MFS family arabinose efflux permease
MLIVVFTSLLILPLSLTVLLAALVAWPFVLDVFWPSQQRRIVELEPAFRGLALAITASFLFTGIAAGSALGGAFYPVFGFASVLLTSIALLTIGLGALLLSVRAMKPKSTATTPMEPSKPRANTSSSNQKRRGNNENRSCSGSAHADRIWG